MATSKSFVLVHGAWHDHHAWDYVVPLLEHAGHMAIALDLPGAGITAKFPASYSRKPFDLEAFKIEISPNSNVTQMERTEAVIDAIRQVNAESDSKAVLVGHSLGGATVSHVGEAISDELSAVVYLSGLMLPPSMLPVTMLEDKLMAESVTPKLHVGDPTLVGALRINPKSNDPKYRSLAKEAFYEDVTDEVFQLALSHLCTDESMQVLKVPSPITKKNFGGISRYFIECLKDHALPIAAQREMVRLVDYAMKNSTTVYGLNTSHSPFFSQPEALANILEKIGG